MLFLHDLIVIIFFSRLYFHRDDIHTRGTDFKFPIPTVAYVTLGRELPKDKLVQASMRMRQLGQGHSVNFLAPKEVYSQLTLLSSPSEPDSSHVIQWTLRNTANQLQSGMLEWATQGMIFSRRVAAMDVMQSGQAGKLSDFTKLVKVPEVTQLSDLYGDWKCSAPAVRVVANTSNHLVESLAGVAGKASPLMQQIGRDILVRCDQYISEMIVNSKCLDEEQERELEEQKEEEKEIRRVRAEKPFKPVEPPGLRQWIRNNRVSEFKSNLLPLWHAMKSTTAFALLPNEDGFDGRVMTTSNYRRTLQ